MTQALGSGTLNLSAVVTGRPAPLRVSLTPAGCQTDCQNARRAPFIAPGVLSRTLSPLSPPPPFHWRRLFFPRPCERRLLAPLSAPGFVVGGREGAPVRRGTERQRGAWEPSEPFSHLLLVTGGLEMTGAGVANRAELGQASIANASLLTTVFNRALLGYLVERAPLKGGGQILPPCPTSERVAIARWVRRQTKPLDEYF